MGLKNEYREILIMRFVNELSLDEIADITGKKKINVRVILHRAITALQEMTEGAKPIMKIKTPRKINISPVDNMGGK
jgi:DNA-directed RNA polymerase specialized sigma24 family protein